MGLAAAKNKRRLGVDPNNNRWSKNTDTFGQKILRAQGWQPGEFLGRQDSSYTQLHSDASASHIRVVLKEDSLGLGAKRNNGDECTGLDAFQTLLGRLNGKSEEVLEEERIAREGVKLTLYVERKYGPMRFVRGGLLVGDKIEDLRDEANATKKTANVPKKAVNASEVESEAKQVEETVDSSASSSEDAGGAELKLKSSKKRKAEKEVDGTKQEKKDKKSKRRKTEEQTESEPDKDAGSKSKKERKEKKEKKEKKTRKSRTKDAETDGEEVDSSKSKKNKRKDAESSISEPQSAVEDAEASSATERKKSKDKSKKDKKDKKRKERRDGNGSDSESETPKKKKSRRKETEEPDVSTASDTASLPTPITSGSSTPLASGASTPISTSSARHLARKRFIAQKRMALSDPKALNQIFMIKSS